MLRDDRRTSAIYQTLVAILETGTWPRTGGLEDQKDFWIDLVATFGPMRRDLEFSKRVNGIFSRVNNGIQSGKTDS